MPNDLRLPNWIQKSNNSSIKEISLKWMLLSEPWTIMKVPKLIGNKLKLRLVLESLEKQVNLWMKKLNNLELNKKLNNCLIISRQSIKN